MTQIQTKWIADGAITPAKLDASTPPSVRAGKLIAARDVVTTFSASSGSSDVTTVVGAAATTNTPITTLTALGVYTGAVANGADPLAVSIRHAGTDNPVDDGVGDAVYGILTWGGSVYTLTYKKADGTAFTFGGATSIDFYFTEVFNLDTVPVEALITGGTASVIDPGTANALTNYQKRNFAVAAVIPALTATYANGSGGIGATLTATVNGAWPATTETIAVGLNDFVLVLAGNVANGLLAAGLYQLTQIGDGSNPWILTRASNMDTPADAKRGCVVRDLAHGSAYVLTADVAAIGTDSFVFQSVQAFRASQWAVYGDDETGNKATFDGSALATASPVVKLPPRNVDLNHITAEQTDVFTLNSSDITNKYVVLSQIPTIAANVKLFVKGSGPQVNGASYDYQMTAGFGGKELSWSALGLDGVLVSGDILVISYLYNG
jgi:hypothetical protein